MNTPNKSMCNKCAKEFLFSTDKAKAVIQKNIMHDITIKFKHGSPFDTTQCTFTLCESCIVDMLLKEFVITPEFVDSNEL